MECSPIVMVFVSISAFVIVSNIVTIIVCHTSEQKVNKQMSRRMNNEDCL